MMIPLCRVTVTTTLLLLLVSVVSTFPNNVSPYSSSSLPTTTISTTTARRSKGADPATTIAPTCTALFILQQEQEEEEMYSPTIFNNLFSMFDNKDNDNNKNSKNKKKTFIDATLVELVERLEEADVGQDLLEEVTMMQDQQQIVELPVMFTGGGEYYYEDYNTKTATTTTAAVSSGMGDLGEFDFERWNIHRSPNRYNRLLVGIFTGITSRRIFPTVLVIVAWTTWVGVYASVETQYGLPEIELPLTPFELASSVLGLLLVFRSNTAFERFNVGSDATWEMTGRFRSIIRQLLSFTSVPHRFSAEERAAAYDLIDACLVLHGWILCDYLQQRSSRKFRGQPSQRQRKQSRSKQAKILQKALALPYDVTKQLLTTSSSSTSTSSSSSLSTGTTTTQNDNDSTSVISMPVPASIRSSQSSSQQSSSSSRTTNNNNNNQRRQSPSGLINTVTLGIFSRIPSLDPQESVMLEAQFTEIISSLGTCEKLLRTPIPLGYTRYSVRFLMIWLMLLPVALVRTFDTFGKNTWWEDKPQPILVIVMLFLSVAFLSIEDISVQLEEPFCVLPLQFHQKWLKKDYTQMKRTARIVDGMMLSSTTNKKQRAVKDLAVEEEKEETEKIPKRTRVRHWILQQRTKATTKVSSFFE